MDESSPGTLDQYSAVSAFAAALDGSGGSEADKASGDTNPLANAENGSEGLNNADNDSDSIDSIDLAELEQAEKDGRLDKDGDKDKNKDSESEPQSITVMIDGKPVQLTTGQIAEAYKGGLKEKDYRQKTMALSEEKKAAQAAAQKAEAERNQYATNLQTNIQQLQTLVQIQDQTNWEELLESDPVEFLRQRNLYGKRQTALNEHRQQYALLQSQLEAHNRELRAEYVRSQRSEMIAKIPAWQDEAKAKAEMAQLVQYLQNEMGFDANTINDISDHRPVVMARKAMLYDQMMSKIATTQKKVANLPARVENPGTSNRSAADDQRAAFKRLSRSGTTQDAAALFASVL